MASVNWKEFKYIPEWEGPLSGRSFERQTEDAINGVAKYAEDRVEERISDAIASAAVIQPYDEAPAAPAGAAGIPGESPRYARGDHRHPAQSSCASAASAGSAGELSPGFALTVTVVPAGEAPENAIASGTVSINGAGDREVVVEFPNATTAAPGLMSPEDKAVISGAGDVPRFASASVENGAALVSGENGSAAASVPGAILAFSAGSGIAMSIAEVSSGGSQRIVVNAGADFGAVATDSAAGFMSPADKALLASVSDGMDSCFAGASVNEQGDTLSLERVNGDVVEIPIGGGESPEAAPMSALSDVQGSFSYKPARLSASRQTVSVSGSVSGGEPEVLASGHPLLRADTPWALPFSTSGINPEGAESDSSSLSVSCSVVLGAEGVASASMSDSAAASSIAAGTPLLHSGIELSVVWDADYASEHGKTDGPTSEFGTFSVEWSRSGEEPFSYDAALTWTPPSGAVLPDEATLNLSETTCAGDARIEEVDFGAVAVPLAELQSEADQLSSAVSSLASGAVVFASLSLNTGISDEVSVDGAFAVGLESGGSEIAFAKFKEAYAVVESGGAPMSCGVALRASPLSGGSADAYAKLAPTSDVYGSKGPGGVWSGGWSSIADMDVSTSCCSGAIVFSSLPSAGLETASAPSISVEAGGSSYVPDGWYSIASGPAGYVEDAAPWPFEAGKAICITGVEASGRMTLSGTVVPSGMASGELVPLSGWDMKCDADKLRPGGQAVYRAGISAGAGDPEETWGKIDVTFSRGVGDAASLCRVDLAWKPAPVSFPMTGENYDSSTVSARVGVVGPVSGQPGVNDYYVAFPWMPSSSSVTSGGDPFAMLSLNMETADGGAMVTNVNLAGAIRFIASGM